MTNKPSKSKRLKSKTPIPFDYFNMTPIPPSNTPPYTRDELIAITLEIFTDMNDKTKLHMATLFADLALDKAKSEADKKSKSK